MVADKKKTGPKGPKLHYLELAEEAIVNLKSTTGCSQQAIEKWIKNKNPGIEIKHALMRLILKKAVDGGRFKVNRFHSNSYMLMNSKTPKTAGKKTKTEASTGPKKRTASKRSSDAEKPAKKAKKSTSRSSSVKKVKAVVVVAKKAVSSAKKSLSGKKSPVASKKPKVAKSSTSVAASSASPKKSPKKSPKAGKAAAGKK